jgi:hypothetical protein
VRNALLYLVAIWTTLFPAKADFIKQVGWPEQDLARLYPKLRCEQSEVLVCSQDNTGCGTLTELPVNQFLVDFQAKTLAFNSSSKQISFSIESATIDEDGFNGDIRLSVGDAVARFTFFKPQDTLTKIKFSYTENDPYNRRQIDLGTCIKAN